MIRGITTEKALQISDLFPSALSLWRHFKSLPDEKSRQLSFCDWKTPDAQRRFGLVLSKRIYRVFYSLYSPDDSL